MKRGPVRYKTCQRWDIPWDAHELTFSCFRQRAFLARDRTRAYLVEAIRLAREKHAFDLWGYVFMPEHVHLLIWPRNEDYSISAILRSIKQSVSRQAIGHLRRNNPEGLKWVATGQRGTPYRFWRPGGGFDRNVRGREAARKMLVYMHNNPVKRGLVVRPDDWPWSSYRDWEGSSPGPLHIDKDSLAVR